MHETTDLVEREHIPTCSYLYIHFCMARVLSCWDDATVPTTATGNPTTPANNTYLARYWVVACQRAVVKNVFAPFFAGHILECATSGGNISAAGMTVAGPHHTPQQGICAVAGPHVPGLLQLGSDAIAGPSHLPVRVISVALLHPSPRVFFL